MSRNQLSHLYDEHSKSGPHLLEWHKIFHDGRLSLKDYACLGQGRLVVTPAVVAEVAGIIGGN